MDMQDGRDVPFRHPRYAEEHDETLVVQQEQLLQLFTLKSVGISVLEFPMRVDVSVV
jgi:hypothetical protein